MLNERGSFFRGYYGLPEMFFLSKWQLISLVFLTLGHSRLELVSLFVISGCND